MNGTASSRSLGKKKKAHAALPQTSTCNGKELREVHEQRTNGLRNSLKAGRRRKRPAVDVKSTSWEEKIGRARWPDSRSQKMVIKAPIFTSLGGFVKKSAV